MYEYFTIFGKPADTDNIIYKDISHFLQQKQAALRHFLKYLRTCDFYRIR